MGNNNVDTMVLCTQIIIKPNEDTVYDTLLKRNYITEITKLLVQNTE